MKQGWCDSQGGREHTHGVGRNHGNYLGRNYGNYLGRNQERFILKLMSSHHASHSLLSAVPTWIDHVHMRTVLSALPLLCALAGGYCWWLGTGHQMPQSGPRKANREGGGRREGGREEGRGRREGGREEGGGRREGGREEGGGRQRWREGGKKGGRGEGR